MDKEHTKQAIRRLIEESAAPKPDTTRCVKHITVIGDNNIVADRVVLHDRAHPYKPLPTGP